MMIALDQGREKPNLLSRHKTKNFIIVLDKRRPTITFIQKLSLLLMSLVITSLSSSSSS